MSGDPVNRAIVRMLRQGMLQREVASALDVNVRSVEERIERHVLTPEAFGLVRIQTLALEVGVTRQALYYRASIGHFALVPWGKTRCVTTAVALTVRALYAGPKRADYGGWLTSAPAAQAVGLSPEGLHRMTSGQDARLDGIRFVRAQGRGGLALLFCPADMAELARRLGRRALPRRYAGRHTVPQFADLAQVPPSRVLRWSRAGAPHRTDLHRRVWFSVPEVRGWLASGVICPRDLPLLLNRLDALDPARVAARNALEAP